MADPAGWSLNHYVVRSLLGKGGMGEVYLAEDTRLGRKVALKVLPDAFTVDPYRLRRFELEARSASALNHPQILTIYEIGHVGATHYIATEFVEGVTLRQLMADRQLPLKEALDIAAQVASALASAHRAGIIHRDIKPENIIVRPDRLVKVLDFGLAKLTEQALPSMNSEAPTITEALSTEPGTIMGTVRYMSPEQARGISVDFRSDIWSLGVVLYEMVTGRAPFDGATKSDVSAAVLREEPAPLNLYTSGVPEYLQWIVRKALTKDREERYQNAQDLRIDLSDLRRELESDAGGQPPATAGRVAGDDGGVQVVSNTLIRPEAGSHQSEDSGLASLINSAGRRRWASLLLLSIVAVFVSGVVYGLYRLASTSRPESSMPFTNIKAVKLTRDGRTKHAAISPDAKFVALVSDGGGGQSLTIRQISAEGTAVLVPPKDVQYLGITFSPDGGYIYFITAEAGMLQGTLYRVPSIGGPVKKLIENVSTAITLSPDGALVGFVRDLPTQGESVLLVANADGSGERRVASRLNPEFFAREGPAWSPDGGLIASSVISYAPSYHEDLIAVSVRDGAERQIVKGWTNIERLSWFKDGSGLMVIANQVGKGKHLWHITYPEGEARQVTNDLESYTDLSLADDSRSLVTVKTVHIANLWLTGAGGHGPAKKLTFGINLYDGVDGLAVTPDGKIVYTTFAGGGRDLWMMDADGTKQKQLTEKAGSNRTPAVSADGRFIVFASTREGERSLWRINTDGNNPVQLAAGKLVANPSFSPDGKWVVYSSVGPQSDFLTLWMISIEGGQAIQLTDTYSDRPSVSPDGKWIACLYQEDKRSALRLAIIPFNGGKPWKTFKVPPALANAAQPVIHWTPDGRMLTYIATGNGVSNVWGQPLGGGDPVPLTAFEAGEIFGFNWSRDGKYLVLSRGSVEGDAVMFSDGR